MKYNIYVKNNHSVNVFKRVRKKQSYANVIAEKTIVIEFLMKMRLDVSSDLNCIIQKKRILLE